MRHWRLALAAFCLAGPAPAAAGFDGPEALFVQTEPLTLPDGRLGEMRQVRGLGILAGPDALLVLDSEGRLLARSRSADALTIVCEGAPRTCHGYDHDKGAMLLLDPAGFRPDGPTIPPFAETDRKAIGPFGASRESWGFTVRPPSLAERAQAEWTHAGRHAGVHALSLLFGALLALLLFVRIGLPRLRTWPRLALWGLSLALRLAASSYILLILATWLILGGFSAVSVLACVGLGAVAVLAPWAILWSRARPATAPA